jgi:TolB-like protein/DNA-binding winged helix-turn-helix (wHTH) protein/cytochrome c-type biogenesis protein CcmH/NrfG
MTRMMDVEPAQRYAFGPFSMDVAERRLQRDGHDVALTRKAFDLLLVLVQGAGHLRTRETLIEQLWPDTIVEEHSLTWNLSALRKALGDTGDSPTYVETVRGHGYRFIAEVTRQGDEPATAAVGLPRRNAESSRGDVVRRPRARRRLALVAGSIVALATVATVGWLTASRRDATSAAGPGASHSIAVLPFENLSPDAANAYFASGIQDTILTKLAGIGDIRVVSRTSTEAYASHPADVTQVARQLDVATVLEGSVQKAGDQVRINVQLIDARGGGHLWAQTYTRALDDVFKVQSDVASQVALALQARLLPGEASRVASLPTEDALAYDLFLKGEYAALQIESGNASSPADATAQARDFYQQAIAHDPRFALALARLSYLDSHAYWLDIDHTPARSQAGELAASQALALDPDLPQAHLAMGYAHYYGHRDYVAALAEFQQALRDLPNNADINASIANIDRRRGHWPAALAGYERAAALDPRNPQWPILLGDSLTVLRRYDQAVAAYDRALAVDPGNSAAVLYKSLSLLLGGDLPQARSILAAVPRQIDPEGLGSAMRFAVAWASNDPDGALAALAGAPDLIEAPWTPGFVPSDLLRAQALQLKGDRDGALADYASARDSLLQTSITQAGNPAVWSLLGLAQAGLGDATEALKSGQHAVELLPIERDAMDGPYYPATLADIRLRTGDPAGAAAILRELLAMPAGRVISLPLIAQDPRYAAVRGMLAPSGAPR